MDGFFFLVKIMRRTRTHLNAALIRAAFDWFEFYIFIDQ